MRKGITTEITISYLLGLLGASMATISPFVAPFIGSVAIYIYSTGMSDAEDNFSLGKALINGATGAIIGGSIVHFLGKAYHLDAEGIYYAGFLIGAFSPSFLSILADKDFISGKMKDIINFVTRKTKGK